MSFWTWTRATSASGVACMSGDREEDDREQSLGRKRALDHSIQRLRHHTLRMGRSGTLFISVVDCVGDRVLAVEAVAKSEVCDAAVAAFASTDAPQRKRGTGSFVRLSSRTKMHMHGFTCALLMSSPGRCEASAERSGRNVVQ